MRTKVHPLTRTRIVFDNNKFIVKTCFDAFDLIYRGLEEQDYRILDYLSLHDSVFYEPFIKNGTNKLVYATNEIENFAASIGDLIQPDHAPYVRKRDFTPNADEAAVDGNPWGKLIKDFKENMEQWEFAVFNEDDKISIDLTKDGKTLTLEFVFGISKMQAYAFIEAFEAACAKMKIVAVVDKTKEVSTFVESLNLG